MEPLTLVDSGCCPMRKRRRGVDNIGRHLLDAKALLRPPPGERKEVRVDPKIFDGYMRY